MNIEIQNMKAEVKVKYEPYDDTAFDPRRVKSEPVYFDAESWPRLEIQV